MRKIKLGYIGCGIVVKDLHWPALSLMQDKFCIVNAASRNAEKAKAFAALCGASRYCTDPEELLKDEEVEAVVIAYPFEMNYDLTRKALDAGKHVLVEKPMAASMEQAAQMCQWEQNSDKVTMIAENFRYHEIVKDARHMLDQGIIGKPAYMTYTLVNHFERDSKWLTQSFWRTGCVGGIQLDKDVHYAAVMRCLMGDAKYAFGYNGIIGEDVGMDCVNLNVVFENGAFGTLNDVSTVYGFGRNNEILIFGNEGTMVLEGYQTLRVQKKNGELLEKDYPADNRACYVAEFNDFYDSIITGKAPKSSFLEGYKDLQLAMASIVQNEKWENHPLLV